jgi:hypothetical protein
MSILATADAPEEVSPGEELDHDLSGVPDLRSP